MHTVDLNHLQHHLLISNPLLLNNQTPISIQQEFEDIDCQSLEKTREGMLYIGGVSHIEKTFILHNYTCKLYKDSYVSGPLCLGSSEEIVKDYIEHKGSDILRVFKGWMHWKNEQLIEEIKNNTWLVAPPNYHIAFADSIKRMYKAALQSIGIDVVHADMTDTIPIQ